MERNYSIPKFYAALIPLFLVLFSSLQGQKPELVTQTRQQDVRSIAISPDGRIFASGDSNKTIKLWDLQSGRVIRTILTENPQDLLDEISSLDFSPDGKVLASGLAIGKVMLWNIETGKKLNLEIDLDSRGISLTEVAFSHDGNTLAITGADLRLNSEILLWNLAGNELKTLTKQSSKVYSIDFHPKEKILASAGFDKKVTLWDIETGNKLPFTLQHEDSVNVVRFSSDGQLLASGDNRNIIKIWDVATGKEKGKLSLPPPDDLHLGILSLAFSPDNKKLLSTSGDGDEKIRIWSLETGKQLEELTGHIDRIRSIDFSKDGKTLISAGEDGSIRLWGPENLKNHKIFLGTLDAVYNLAVSPDGKLLASSYLNNKLRVWNLEKGEANDLQIGGNNQRKITDLEFITSLEFSPGGKILASGGNKGIKLWDVEKKAEIKPFSNDDKFCEDCLVSFPTFSPDGKTFATTENVVLSRIDDSVNQLSTITLWKTDDFKPQRVFQVETGNFTEVAFSWDGKTIAGGTDKGLIKLWDASSGKLLHVLQGHSFNVLAIEFSPDRKTLASGSIDSIKLWDLESGRPLKAQFDKAVVEKMAFSPDGRLLASIDGYEGNNGVDGNIFIWDVESGKKIKTIVGHFGRIRSVKFNLDGKTVITAGNDGKIMIWDLNNGNELCTLIATDNNDWLVTTPDGFFDGTPNAQKQILWRLNNSTFDAVPVEAFYYEYYYPGLLKKLLAGEKPQLPPKAIPFEQKDTRQPEVQIFDGKCSEEKKQSAEDKFVALNSIQTILCLELTASPYFSVQDFQDFESLIEKLILSRDSISKSLFSKFLPENQKRLRDFVNSATKSSDRNLTEIRQIIKQEFNSIVRNPFFYQNNKLILDNYINSPEILELLKMGKNSDELSLINRKLLEKVYPRELKTLRVDNLRNSNTNESNKSESGNAQSQECRAGEMCLQDMRLFRNGRLLNKWRGDILNYCQKPTDYRIQCQVQVPLVIGTENKYNAYLFNQDRVKSKDGELILR